MSNSNSGFNGNFIDCTLKTMEKEGITGLYRGIVSPMTTIPLVNAVVFSSYGFAKSLLLNDKTSSTLTFAEAMYAGIVNCWTYKIEK